MKAGRGWMQSEAEQGSAFATAGPMPFCWVTQHCLYHTPRVIALSLCGWLMCAVWAATAVRAAANDHQSKA